VDEWVVDTGSNRFVTNDVCDFVPGSIKYVNSRVLVGNGHVISPCEGTVMIRSHTNGALIECTRTLLLSECDKKLMPARPFLRKGCTLQMSEKGGVKMIDPSGKTLLHGEEKQELYYYSVTTAQPAETSDPASRPKSIHCERNENSSSYFGLPVGSKLRATGDDFVRKLSEAHQALGHIHFDKVRKLFGLKPGPNPACATCSVAKQKQSHLTQHAPSRSPYPNHRIHMDLAFTEGSDNPFQVCRRPHPR